MNTEMNTLVFNKDLGFYQGELIWSDLSDDERHLASSGALVKAGLKVADFTGADLEGAKLMKLCAGHDPANFKCANLTSTNLERAFLSYGVFKNTNLYNTKLDSSTLCEADFSHSHGDRPSFRGAYLIEANFDGAKIPGADLTASEAMKVIFRKSDLRGANLHYANFEGADFRGADLRGCNFVGARLRWALFEGADLRGADLKSVARLGARSRHEPHGSIEANFDGAILDGAMF